MAASNGQGTGQGGGQGPSNGIWREDFAPVWDAVCAAYPVLIEHMTGAGLHNAIGLNVVVRAFHEHTVKLQRAVMPSDVVEAFTHYPDSPWYGQAMHGRDALQDAVERLWKECYEALKAAKMASPDAKLGLWDAGDDDYDIPPREWLLGNIFCKGFLSSLLANGGVGKSALRMAQILSLAIGRPLTGQHVFRRCRCLIISLEDSKDELRRRVYAVMLKYGITPAEVKGWLFLAAPKGMKLAQLVNGAPEVAELEDLLRGAIKAHSLDLVNIDPFVKSHSLNENDNNAIDFVSDLASTIAIDLNVAIDFPHHTNKHLSLDPGNADRGRGASAAKDAARLVYTLTPMSPEEAEKFGLTEAQRKHLVREDSAKVNIAPPSDEATWFELVGVPLGNGTDAYPKGDNIQIVKPWTPPKMLDGTDSLILNEILSSIDKGLPNGQRYSDANRAGEGRAAWRVVQQYLPDKPEGACRAIINAWVKSGLLYREEYHDPIQNKDREGLKVDATKRPS